MTWDTQVSINIWVLLVILVMAILGAGGGLWAFVVYAFRDFMVRA